MVLALRVAFGFCRRHRLNGSRSRPWRPWATIWTGGLPSSWPSSPTLRTSCPTPALTAGTNGLCRSGIPRRPSMPCSAAPSMRSELRTGVGPKRHVAVLGVARRAVPRLRLRGTETSALSSQRVATSREGWPETERYGRASTYPGLSRKTIHQIEAAVAPAEPPYRRPQGRGRGWCAGLGGARRPRAELAVGLSRGMLGRGW